MKDCRMREQVHRSSRVDVFNVADSVKVVVQGVSESASMRAERGSQF